MALGLARFPDYHGLTAVIGFARALKTRDLYRYIAPLYFVPDSRGVQASAGVRVPHRGAGRV